MAATAIVSGVFRIEKGFRVLGFEEDFELTAIEVEFDDEEDLIFNDNEDEAKEREIWELKEMEEMGVEKDERWLWWRRESDNGGWLYLILVRTSILDRFEEFPVL